MRDILPAGFNIVVNHYAKHSRVPILLSTAKELVGPDNFEEVKKFVIENELGELQNLTKEKCGNVGCNESAIVKNHRDGIVSCVKGHLTRRDPLNLVQLVLKSEKITGLFGLLLSEKLNIVAFQGEVGKYTPFGACGFEPLGVTEIDGMRIIFLASFKPVKLKDAVMLQGLIANTLYDSFVLLIESMEEQAEKYLAYNTGGVVQFALMDTLLQHNADIGKLVEQIKSETNVKTIRLQSYLKNELHNVKSVVTPDMFQSLLEFDSKLVNRSFNAATSGNDDEFEDMVASLLGSILPVTQLGHNITAMTDGKKIEAPDGIIQIPKPRQHDLELIFYDCKSIGTAEKRKDTKRISQSDEDAFARYCNIFSSDKMTAKLSGGMFVANDFSDQNMVNKSLQIRTKSEVPRDVKIIFMPLKSLIKLYTRVTTERSKFSLHFESDAIYKLFGDRLNADEEKRLEEDTEFSAFDRIRKSNTNSVYIIEGLVDVFLSHVYSLVSRDSQYLPFVLDFSKRMSSTYR